MFLLLSCLTSVVLYPCSRKACAFSSEKAILHARVKRLTAQQFMHQVICTVFPFLVDLKHNRIFTFSFTYSLC